MTNIGESNVDHVEVYWATDGWRWRAKAANGEIVAQGEQHTTTTDAKRAARGVFGAKVRIVTKLA